MSAPLSSQPPKVLVCGGGPAGLVAALSLCKNGIPVRIIEKSLEYQSGTRGPSLAPRSLELLDLLGVLPDVLKTAKEVPPRREYEGGRIVRTWDILEKEPSSPSSPYPNPLLNSQSVTGAALRKHLATYGVQVELGVEITAFTQDASSVTAQLLKTSRDGQKKEETLVVDYVFGMDGARGVTRKLLEIPFAGESLVQNVIVADAAIEGLDRDNWHCYGEPPLRVLHALPMGDSNMFNLVMAGSEIDCDALYAGGIDAIRDYIKGISENNDIKLLDLPWHSIFRPSFRCAESFGVGRVFIGGDNAHVHSPMGGQGLNTSIQDAHNIAWKVAHVLKGVSPPSLLDSYSDERIPVVKCMLGISQQLHLKQAPNVHVIKDDGKGRGAPVATASSAPPAAQSPNSTETTTAAAAPPGPAPRSKGKGAGGGQRSKLIKQLGVNYRWSNIVIDERDLARQGPNGEAARLTAYGIEGADPTEVRAGDRAPDAPVADLSHGGNLTTLFKLFDPSKHTVLVFTNDANTSSLVGEVMEEIKVFRPNMNTFIVSRAAIEKPPNDTRVLVDVDGHARKAYGVSKTPDGESRTVIVVVRPDSVVGAFVFAVEGVKRYCEKVFL